MSDPRQNIAFVQSLYRAFAARDIPSILNVLSSNVEWGEPPNPFNPAGGTRYGHAGFLEWLRVGNESEEVLVLEPRDFLANQLPSSGTPNVESGPTGREYDRLRPPGHSQGWQGAELSRVLRHICRSRGISRVPRWPHLTRRGTRIATAGFARFRVRVSSNIRPLLETPCLAAHSIWKPSSSCTR